MITTIVLTAIATAAIVTALLHRRNAYVYRLEQTSVERAEEIELLRAELAQQQRAVRELLANNIAYRLQTRTTKD